MAVADILKDVGERASTVGRVAGAVALPLAKRTAEVLSGEAPELDAEKRQRAEKLEDEQIAAKSAALENNLAMGQKYGTLTPEQQQQYVDQITGLYSHPRHAPVLMDKLRKAIHPHGTFAQAPEAPLANPTPAGGTAAQDETTREKILADTMGLRQASMDEEIDRRGKITQQGKKSPPLPGNQLPPDAVDVNGQPIGAAARDAQHSFVQYNGAWWPVAKPKPVFKTIKGHSVLVDSQSGAVLRDLGPVGTSKVTTRQTWQAGDDNQMHLVTLTSVTTPEGTQIEVEPESGGAEPPAPENKPSTGEKPKGVGGILPKRSTGARPVSGASPMVPGFSTLARSKNPLFKADAASYKKANDDAIAKGELYKNSAGLLADDKRQTDLELIFAWVRSNIQGAGRLTNTEITQATKAGSFGTRIQSAYDQASSGRIAPQLEQQFLSDIKRSADTAAAQANTMRQELQADPDGAPGGPSNGGQVENWVRDPATGKLVKQ